MKENVDGMAEVKAITLQLERTLEDLVMEYNRSFYGQRPLKQKVERLSEELEMMESWGELNLSESELIELREDKNKLRTEIEVTQKTIEHEAQRLLVLPTLINKTITQKFRLQEKSKGFFKINFTDEKLLNISDYKALSELDIYYPFEELFEEENCLAGLSLKAFNNQPQPFLANIYGEKSSGKTSVLLTLIGELTTLFEAPVLYLMDFNILINDFWEIVDNKNIKHNMDFVRIENRMQITHFLAQKEYEFLVLDLVNASNFNYKFFYSLQKQYPRLSIFYTSIKQMASFKNMTHLTVEVRNGVGKPTKGGNEDRYIIGWNNAHADDFDPQEMEEEFTDHEETPMIQNNQHLPPPMPMYQPMDMEKMFKTMQEMMKIMNPPQAQIAPVIDISSIQKDKHIKLLEQKIERIKKDKAARFKALMNKRKGL